MRIMLAKTCLLRRTSQKETIEVVLNEIDGTDEVYIGERVD